MVMNINEVVGIARVIESLSTAYVKVQAAKVLTPDQKTTRDWLDRIANELEHLRGFHESMLRDEAHRAHQSSFPPNISVGKLVLVKPAPTAAVRPKEHIDICVVNVFHTRDTPCECWCHSDVESSGNMT